MARSARPVGAAGLLLVVLWLVAGCSSGDGPADFSETVLAPMPTSAPRPGGVTAAPQTPSAVRTPPPSRAASAAPAVSPSPSTSSPPVRAALAGVTVVLDAGHNGGNAAEPARLASPVPAGGFSKPCNTVGASTDAGYPEHAFALDVVLRASAHLRARGATVVLTRSDDDGVGPCVDARAAVGNRAEADAVVSIHADGGPASGRGFHVIAPALAPDGGNAGVLEPSYRLALAVRDEFRGATGMPAATYTASDGLVRRADLAGLNLSRVPAVLLECGNMRNAVDAAALSSPVWRERAATAVATAVERFVTAG